MSYRPRYNSGNWKAVCDSCGRIFPASELQQRWDGLKVCRWDYEIRQPQDFVKGQADKITPAYVRVEPANTFRVRDYVSTSYAGPISTGTNLADNITILDSFTSSRTTTLPTMAEAATVSDSLVTRLDPATVIAPLTITVNALGRRTLGAKVLG